MATVPRPATVAAPHPIRPRLGGGGAQLLASAALATSGETTIGFDPVAALGGQRGQLVRPNEDVFVHALSFEEATALCKECSSAQVLVQDAQVRKHRARMAPAATPVRGTPKPPDAARLHLAKVFDAIRRGAADLSIVQIDELLAALRGS